MVVKIIPIANPLTNLFQSKVKLKRFLFIIMEIKIIPFIQSPIKGCMLINNAENKPAKNKFPLNKRPKIRVIMTKDVTEYNLGTNNLYQFGLSLTEANA